MLNVECSMFNSLISHCLFYIEFVLGGSHRVFEVDGSSGGMLYAKLKHGFSVKSGRAERERSVKSVNGYTDLIFLTRISLIPQIFNILFQRNPRNQRQSIYLWMTLAIRASTMAGMARSTFCPGYACC